MARSREPILFPVVIKTGGILHDTDYHRGASSREEAAQIDAALDDYGRAHDYGADYVMEEVKPFRARLRFLGVAYGKGKHWDWANADNPAQHFPMLPKDASEFLTSANLTNGVTDEILWQPIRKGAGYMRYSYGIKEVKES